MEPKGSLQCSQEPPLVPILSQINPVHTSHAISRELILILTTYLRLDPLSGLFPSGFPINILHELILYLIRATCPTHLILITLSAGYDS
jgi:hypothetical protein